jgi:hypothetical protein
MSDGVDLEAAWSEVESDWDDQARHTAFITRCQLAGQLGFAATRYRGVANQMDAYRSLASRADDAKKRLDGIVALALASMQATATPPDDTGKPLRWLKAIAVLVFIVAALFLFRACST